MTLNLPALPTEFEVAVIKPTPPDFRFGNFRPQRGRRVTIEGMPLRSLIQQAWNLYSRDMIVDAPKFIDSDRYDITAEAPTYGPEPEATSDGPSEGARFQTIDQDSINVMLRNLLIERFKIKYHTEERPSTAFILTTVKPKMKKADPANRTGYHEGPGPDGKDPRIANPAVGRLVTCENMTMKQLAQNLPMMAGGYIQGATVYDETGIEGAFDFTLSFSGAGMVGGAGRGGRGGDGMGAGAVEAPEPSGAISLYEAIEKQLGLKLQQTKRPAQVLARAGISIPAKIGHQ
ncbi:MAG: TIGR03435 family protein [Bryobacteraceae bacterium]